MKWKMCPIERLKRFVRDDLILSNEITLAFFKKKNKKTVKISRHRIGMYVR